MPCLEFWKLTLENMARRDLKKPESSELDALSPMQGTQILVSGVEQPHREHRIIDIFGTAWS